MQTRPTARIKFHGLHVASVGREAFDVIADQPLFDDRPKRPATTAATFRRFLEPGGPPGDKRRRVTFAAGLVHRVVKALEGNGLDVRGGDHRFPMCEYLNGEPLAGNYSEYLLRTYRRPRAILVVPKLTERVRFIAELCMLECESHVLIVARNNQQAMEVAGMLAEATGREATWGFNQRCAYPWLHVKSVQALFGDSAFQWRFVIFLDAELAISKTATEFLAPGVGSVRIGFLASDEQRLHDEELGVLEGLFGPIIYRPGDEYKLANVSVFWLQPRKCNPRPSDDALERKRNHIWANDSRNRLIARAARALRSQDSTALEMLGLHDAVSHLLSNIHTQPPTVAILAANREHAQKLARLLSGWRLETAGYMPPARTLVSDDQVILTLARAGEILIDPSAIIFAAGGHDEWLEHVWGVGCSWSHEAMLILDVADAWDAQARSETESRAAGYRHRGYAEIAVSDPRPMSVVGKPGRFGGSMDP